MWSVRFVDGPWSGGLYHGVSLPPTLEVPEYEAQSQLWPHQFRRGRYRLQATVVHEYVYEPSA